MAKNGIDLSKLSIPELQALAQDVQAEIVTRRETEKQRVLAQMRELAASVGLSLEELLKQERGRERARVPGTSVRFRHPENTALAWSGRGKRPQWIIEWLASGRTLEDLSSGE